MDVIGILGGIRAAVFAALALLALVAGGVQTFRLGLSQHALEVHKQALATNAKKFAEWKLKAEADKAAAVAEVDKKHHEQQQDVKDEADRTIAALRNDNVQLRKRFTCPAREQSGSSDAPVSGTDAEGEGGLTTEDAEFLVREAADSDRKSIKINALIDIIEAYLKRDK